MRKLFFALMLAGALCACENSFVEEENFNTDNQPSTEIPEDYVRLDLLTERIRELGLEEEQYSWYLDLRRFGSCRHAGFGLGFERLVMYVTGIGNIRDVLPFPRTTGSAEF
jgi:hypothetical protein